MVKVNFITKPTLVKRNGVTILGLYPDEKLARKMTKANHVLRVPRAGLTIDAETYEKELSNKYDWSVIFEIDDGRHFCITVPEFNQRKHYIDRGQGKQVVVDLVDLHHDVDCRPLTTASNYNNFSQPAKPPSPQLCLFGGDR